MPYRAVLFDFDGTLTPSLPLWIRAYQIAMAQYGIVLDEAEVRRRCLFRDWTQVAIDFSIGSGEQFRAHVDAGLKVSFLDAQLFPLARELIEHCRFHGLQTALVTSSPRGPVADVLDRLVMGGLFDFVICGDEVQNYKPHPEALLTTLAALECAPADAVMIGDSHVDILAGKAAGTRTALFLPVDHDRFDAAERLLATAPDHIFYDHSAVPQLLGLPPLAVFESEPAERLRW
ncbi:MAG TPA: HAD family phosphatase [Steroidobacteraceae bacterium]|jgi:HAD superfamily hydrolase (TIGR01509 family)